VVVSAAALVAAAWAAVPLQAQDERMSFFITSEGPGRGADLGGLTGADAHCTALAEAAGSTGYDWHAYLSTIPADGSPAVHARDRIGPGPWFNYRGVMVARDVDHLHSDDNALSKENSLTERGTVVNGRGDRPNMHDILTGSTLDGRAYIGEDYDNCRNWTSSGAGRTRVGHHDRTGGGENPTSWNSAHNSRGCSLEDLRRSGGNGLFYCFGTPSDGGASEPRRTSPAGAPEDPAPARIR